MCAPYGDPLDLVLAHKAARALVRAFEAQQEAMAAHMTAQVWRVAEWRLAHPVLAAGWDDWSRLVREEGWR